jgi:lysozyme
MQQLKPETRAKLKDLLIQDEGYRQFPYKCTAGKLTIGIGRNIEDRGISKDEALFLLNNDIDVCLSELRNSFTFFDALNDARKIVLINMCFNLGIPKLMQFRKMREAIEQFNFVEASKQMLDSKWAKDVGHRAERLAFIMEKGEL